MMHYICTIILVLHTYEGIEANEANDLLQKTTICLDW